MASKLSNQTLPSAEADIRQQTVANGPGKPLWPAGLNKLLEEEGRENDAPKPQASAHKRLGNDDDECASSNRRRGGPDRPVRTPLVRVLGADGAASSPGLIDGEKRAEGRRRGASGKDGREVEASGNRSSEASGGRRLLPLRWSSRSRSPPTRPSSEQPVRFHIVTDSEDLEEPRFDAVSSGSFSRRSIGPPTSNYRLSQILSRRKIDDTIRPSSSRLSFRFPSFSSLLRTSSLRLSNRSGMISAASAGGWMATQADGGQAPAEETTPSSFLRTDSIIIRIKPGQCFSEFSNIVVESPARCDPRLGTLGELRHHLRTGTKQQVKRFLRQNNWTSGHRIRAELWKELCHDNNSDAQRAVYRDIVDKIGSLQTRPAFLTSPGVGLCDHQLKENGRLCLLRLLTAVEHQRPDFTYVPVLYPLGALFLHYMNEEEAFACIMNLISQSQKFLIQTDIATTASKRTMLVLMKKHVSRAYSLCKRLTDLQGDNDLVAIFDDWKSWIFRDLPFSHLVRVVDCFLFEGQKVLFRVALAILQLWSAERAKTVQAGKTWTTKEAAADIAEYCKMIKVQPPKLLKTSFGIRNLKMSTVSRLQQKHEMSLRRGASEVVADVTAQKQANLAQHYIDVQFESKILNQTQAMQLISWIPSRYQLQTPCKLFCTDQDGTSFTRLWTVLDSFSPTIILIKTARGEIFGAYCSEAWDSWKRQSGTAYFGTGETFLFRFPGNDGEKFAWVGTKKSSITHSEELFQAADSTTLVVGGGGDEGLSIRQSLESGSSGHSLTFDNPMLSADRDFDVQALEAFCFSSGE